MKILVAPDKFRGSLEAQEVCLAIQQGILLVNPSATVHLMPLADGGEGTLEILTHQAKGTLISLKAKDALGRVKDCQFGLSADGTTAFIEMAAASGLNALQVSERNPLLTSSYGTGELIAAALDRGVRNIVLGIGGSATNDAGMGVAVALGYRFYDHNNTLLQPIGESLEKVSRVDASAVHPRLKEVSFITACDVQNPLFGDNGAAFIYGPQKGATPAIVLQLDRGLRHFSRKIAEWSGKDIADLPGAGAAGGMGAGSIWFLNATLKEGVELILEQSGIKESIQEFDLVITGEGKVDQQTLQGKVVKGLARYCAPYQVPIAVLCGTLAISPQEAQAAGITYASSIITKPMTLEEASQDAARLVTEATCHLISLFQVRSTKTW